MTLNRNLVGLGAIMILAGISFGFYILSFIGILVLIPALLSPSRIPTRPPPTPTRQEVRRISPPSPTKQPWETTQHVQPKPTPTVPATPPMATPVYSPALFPNSIFPSVTQVSAYPQPTAPSTTPAKPAERDEILEVGAILAFLRLAFG